MKTMEFVRRADIDKFVRVAVPVDDADRNYRLIVTVEPETAPQAGKPLDEWPPGFIDRTYGGWQGELERAPQDFLSDESMKETAGKSVGELERQPQGDYEKRIPFDDQ